MTAVDPRYPIGRFSPPADYPDTFIADCIRRIEQAPARLRDAVAGLTDAQLDTPYRDGGWTVRQLIHHVADSHMNASIRFRLALTEEEPTIKPYREGQWARLEDAAHSDIGSSLTLLDALHRRWVILLRSMTHDQFRRRLNHPENGAMTLERSLALYAWHGEHHAAHVTALRDRMHWR